MEGEGVAVDLYIDGNDIYYCPNKDGNAFLAVDSDTGDIYAIPQSVTQSWPTLPVNTTQRTNMQFTGPGIAQLRSPQGTFTVNGIIAQILPNGETPKPGPFLPGLGNSAMELRDNPSITNYSAVIPNAQIGVAASFVEVGAWQ